MRYILKFFTALFVAYVCASPVVAYQSLSNFSSSESSWAVLLAPYTLVVGPFLALRDHPVISILWFLAFYIIISIAFDRYNNKKKTEKKLTQPIVRKLLITLPIVYISAGIVLLILETNKAEDALDVMMILLISGVWLLVVGPIEAIAYHPVQSISIGVVLTLGIYMLLSLIGKFLDEK